MYRELYRPRFVQPGAIHEKNENQPRYTAMERSSGPVPLNTLREFRFLFPYVYRELDRVYRELDRPRFFQPVTTPTTKMKITQHTLRVTKLPAQHRPTHLPIFYFSLPHGSSQPLRGFTNRGPTTTHQMGIIRNPVNCSRPVTCRGVFPIHIPVSPVTSPSGDHFSRFGRFGV